MPLLGERPVPSGPETDYPSTSDPFVILLTNSSHFSFPSPLSLPFIPCTIREISSYKGVVLIDFDFSRGDNDAGWNTIRDLVVESTVEAGVEEVVEGTDGEGGEELVEVGVEVDESCFERVSEGNGFSSKKSLKHSKIFLAPTIFLLSGGKRELKSQLSVRV